MASEFFLDDRQWAVIQPLLPTSQPGAHRVDDRQVVSGIIHVLRTGCRWRNTPSICRPPTTVYNRFHRLSQRGIWQALFAALIEVTSGGIQAIDSTTAKAQRAAAGGKGAARRCGRKRRSALLRAEKGRACPSHRPIPRWTRHQDPQRGRQSPSQACLADVADQDILLTAAEKYSVLRRFSPRFLASFEFQSNAPQDPVLDAIEAIKAADQSGSRIFAKRPSASSRRRSGGSISL